MRRMRAKTCKTQVTPDIRKFFTNVMQKRFKNNFLRLISRTRVHVSSPKSLNETSFLRGSAGREINGLIRNESTNFTRTAAIRLCAGCGSLIIIVSTRLSVPDSWDHLDHYEVDKVEVSGPG